MKALAKQVLSAALMSAGLLYPVFAADITVPEFSFESPTAPADPGWTVGNPAGWISTNATETGFQLGTTPPLTGVQGLQVAWVNGNNSITSSGDLHTIAAGDIYTLKVAVATRGEGPPPGFQIQLTNSLLTSFATSAVTSPDFGSAMVDYTISYTVGQNDPLIGQGLRIKLAKVSGGNQVNFDNVRLTVNQATFTSNIIVIITPNGQTPGNYDFSWNSQEGKIYDLVSATDLSSPPATWLPWDNRTGIVATPSTNILLDVPGGGDTKRFFILVEKDQ